MLTGREWEKERLTDREWKNEMLKDRKRQGKASHQLNRKGMKLLRVYVVPACRKTQVNMQEERDLHTGKEETFCKLKTKTAVSEAFYNRHSLL